MKRYYELSTDQTLAHYIMTDAELYTIHHIVQVSRTPAIHPVYTFNDAVKHMQDPEVLIGYWSIPMPLCSLMSEYYALTDYLVINKDQFTRRLEIK